MCMSRKGHTHTNTHWVLETLGGKTNHLKLFNSCESHSFPFVCMLSAHSFTQLALVFFGSLRRLFDCNLLRFSHVQHWLCQTIVVHLPVSVVQRFDIFLSANIFREIQDLFVLLQCVHTCTPFWWKKPKYRIHSTAFLFIFFLAHSSTHEKLYRFPFHRSRLLYFFSLDSLHIFPMHVFCAWCSPFCIFAWWMSKLGNSSILNLVAFCFLFIHGLCTIRFCVNVPNCVCVCVCAYRLPFLPSISRYGCLLHIHYLYVSDRKSDTRYTQFHTE